VKQKIRKAVARGDGRDGDKEAHAEKRSASVNSYRLSIHECFVFTSVAIAAFAAVGGDCKNGDTRRLGPLQL
jgi:hypothetical protein